MDPHWFGFLDPDPHRDKMLDPDPHWNQHGLLNTKLFRKLLGRGHGYRFYFFVKSGTATAKIPPPACHHHHTAVTKMVKSSVGDRWHLVRIRFRMTSCFAYYLFKLHLHHFSQKKSQKEVTVGIKVFILFLLYYTRIQIRTYRRCLQLSKEAIQHIKTWTLKNFFYFCGSFLPSIRILNTGKKGSLLCRHLPVDGEPVEAGGWLEYVVGLEGAVHHHHLHQSCGQQIRACTPDRSQ